MSGPAKPFYGTILNGRPVLDDPEGFQTLKESLEGERIEIYLTKSPDQAHSAQHRYYRGIVVKKFAKHTGHTEAEVHTGFKTHFLLDRSDPALPRVRSTGSLSKDEFTRYIDDCIQLCAEYGCPIDDPR